MHIIVITGYYYPYLVPPAGCIKRYLDDLKKNNEVEVVCPTSSIHYSGTIENEGIKVNYINSIPNRVYSYIRTNQEEHRLRRLTKFLFVIYRGLRYIKSLFSRLPFETSLVKAYVNKLEMIHKTQPIDLMISVSFNFYTHASALQFKKMRPTVRWITYTTDPLAYNEVNLIDKRKLQTAIDYEQEVYSTCDFCITTEELYPNLINDFHICHKKILALPFLLLNSPLSEIQSFKHERITVFYAGYLYFEIRNPKSMIEIFSRLDMVDLTMNVEGDRFIRGMLSKDLPENISVNGLVSREKYIELIGEADFLINLGNKVSFQAPSKLMELLSTGKPIINFYYNEDSGYRIIDKYPLGLNISNDMNYDEAARRIKLFISENVTKRMAYSEVVKMFSEHTLTTQMPKINRVIYAL